MRMGDFFKFRSMLAPQGAPDATLATVRQALPENGTYTVPDGTGHVINTASNTVYGTTFKFPAVPVVGQDLILSTANNIQKITLNGNGAPVVGDQVISLLAGTGVMFRHNATSGWVPVTYNPMTHWSAATKVVAQAFGDGGWGWKQPGRSFDYYVGSGKAWLQSTANGLAANGGIPYLEFYAENTIDPGNASADNGRYSYSGLHAKIYDSSIPFGAGVTADAKVEAYLAVTCRNNQGAACAWTGAPSGAAAWLSWGTSHATRAVPMYIGDLKGGMRAQFDEAGNFRTTKMSVDESVQRDTGTADFTVSDNVSTCVLAGSGTVAVAFPAAPVNGQTLTLTLETVYTEITLSGNGKTLVSGVVGIVSGSFATWRYHAAAATWNRVG